MNDQALFEDTRSSKQGKLFYIWVTVVRDGRKGKG